MARAKHLTGFHPHQIVDSGLTAVGLLLTIAGGSLIQLSAGPQTPSSKSVDVPMVFEENRGQTVNSVQFIARANNYVAFVESTGVHLRATPPDLDDVSLGDLRLEFVGASPEAKLEPVGPVRGQTNYLIGSQQSDWVTGIPHFHSVAARDLYPGIDIVYRGSGGELEYDIVAAPGADLSQVRIAVSGAESLRISEDGTLVATTETGEVWHRVPMAYQILDGEKTDVQVRTRITHGNQLCFDADGYDDSRTLVVDPVIAFGSRFGSGGSDYPKDVAVDATGQAFVAGFSDANAVPSGSIGFGTSVMCCAAATVMKLNASGTAILYRTFIGGPRTYATAIDLDASGSAIVAGYTNSGEFPVTIGNPQIGIHYDGFVLKLNSTGSALIYSRLFDGTSDDKLYDVFVDDSGSTYVVGETDSDDFPTTSQAYQENHSGFGMPSGVLEAVVAKLAVDGSVLWSTYLGAPGNDGGSAIVVDSTGSPYVTGYTKSFRFPVTPGAFQTEHTASLDNYQTNCFISRLSPDGKNLWFSTFLGDRGAYCEDIDIGPGGNVYVAGFRGYYSPPPESFQDISILGADNGFVAKLDQNLSSTIFMSPLGGSEDDTTTAMDVDSAGNVFVAGRTESADFPVTPGAPQVQIGGNYSGYVMMIREDFSGLHYSTYLGGSFTSIWGMDLDASGNAYVVGESYNADSAQITNNLTDGVEGSGFVVKIDHSSPCAFSISHSREDLGTGAAELSVAVNTQNGCGWFATKSQNVDWVSFASDTSNSGSGVIQISVDENLGTPRETTLSIAGYDFVIAQADACSVSLMQESAEFTEWGGERRLHLTTGPGCILNVESADWWLDVGSVVPSQGYISYRVWENYDGPARQSTITVDDKVFTVHQLAWTGVPVSVELAPAGGAGSNLHYDFHVWHVNGKEKIRYVQLNFSKPQSALDACYIHYDPAANVIYLLNDDATQWYGVYADTNANVSNSQCLVYGAFSGPNTANDGMLEMNFHISFRAGFAGRRNSYAYVGDVDGKDSGWLQMGSWDVEADPRLTEVLRLEPLNGSGSSETFALVLSDSDGSDDIWFAQISLNAGLDAYNGCYIHHDPDNNVFYLLDDSATEWHGMYGGSGQVENGQCRLVGAGSSNARNGDELTITYQLEFKNGFSGAKDIYVQAAGKDSRFFPWRRIGGWTVP